MNNYFIGVDLGGTNVRAGAVDTNGNIILKKKTLSLVKRGKDKVIETTIKLIDNILSSLKDIPPKAIGIGIPGVISQEKGIVFQSPNFPDWQDFHFLERVKEYKQYSNIPFIIDNDANCATIGEGWIGAAENVDSFCCLTIGTGIGGGIVLNGELWRGLDGMAGELGHIIIDYNGPRCGCGGKGCLEVFASAGAIINMAKHAIDNSDPLAHRLKRECQKNTDMITAELIYRLAVDSDPLSISILRKIGYYLGIGLATIVNMLNIDMIVIGGGVAGAWEFFIPSAIDELKKRTYKIPADRVKITKALNGDNAGIIGAAYLAYKNC